MNAISKAMKQMKCQHEFEHIARVKLKLGFYTEVYRCKKCGKFKEERVVQ